MRSPNAPAAARSACRIPNRSGRSSCRRCSAREAESSGSPSTLCAVTRAFAETLAVNPLNAKELLQTFSVYGVWVIMFVETGLLVGFFFPGDSLLFLAGIAASPAAAQIVGVRLSLPLLLIGSPICAILGAQLGH